LKLKVLGAEGEPLQLQLVRAEGLPERSGEPLTVCSTALLQRATGQPLNHGRLQEQLGRLGGTPWQLELLDLSLQGDLFLPVAELNRLRRQLVDALAQLEPLVPAVQRQPDRQPVDLPSCLQRLGPLSNGSSQQTSADTEAAMADTRTDSETTTTADLIVLVRSLEQLKALRDQPVAAVVADLDQPTELREAVAIGRGCWPKGIWLAGARITRPDERWSLDPLVKARPDGYLVRNADQLELLTPLAPCHGDFSLNVANPLTAAWFLEHWGLRSVTASYDLDLQQMLALLRGCPAGSVAVTVHQHMPLFHMEHCLFCAFLSQGHDHTDCGRPCEQHSVVLRDRSGSEHPLLADLGCRNTLFNGKAQTAAEALPRLLQAGVQQLRLELLLETADQARQRVQKYAAALRGELSGRELWQREQLDSRLGVTRGSLRPSRSVG
jgi:putative protease